VVSKSLVLALSTLVVLIALSGNSPALDPVAGDPVVNGDFELHLDTGLSDDLAGTPVDECIGIGHQVFYGSQSWQQRLENAALAAADGDLEGAQENTGEAAGMWAEDPLHEIQFLSGYGHCVANNQDGTDMIWFNPAHNLDRDVIHWSHQDDNTRFGHFGDQPQERSARIDADTSASNHNLWQAWPSPFQAYTGDFDALTFQVKAGTLENIDPANGGQGRVVLSFSATPLQQQSPWVLLFLDCDLTFTQHQIFQAAQAVEGTTRDYFVTLDPTEGVLRSRFDPSCLEAEQAWDAADPGSDDRREILGKLRMVQLSFWNYNRGPGPVVLDHVSIQGASTFAEQIAAGNFNVDPAL
jgi:hypothetical protein